MKKTETELLSEASAMAAIEKFKRVPERTPIEKKCEMLMLLFQQVWDEGYMQGMDFSINTVKKITDGVTEMQASVLNMFREVLEVNK